MNEQTEYRFIVPDALSLAPGVRFLACYASSLNAAQSLMATQWGLTPADFVPVRP